jgi:hypothetical protein
LLFPIQKFNVSKLPTVLHTVHEIHPNTDEYQTKSSNHDEHPHSVKTVGHRKERYKTIDHQKERQKDDQNSRKETYLSSFLCTVTFFVFPRLQKPSFQH